MPRIDTEHAFTEQAPIAELVTTLMAAIEAPGIDDVLQCFDKHCVLRNADTKRTYEGLGGARAYLGSVAPRLRYEGAVDGQILSLDVRPTGWALAKVAICRRSDHTAVAYLTLSLTNEGNGWRISHMVWEQEAPEHRAA